MQNEVTILTAWRKYFQPGKGCTFLLHSFVGPSSILVVPCNMERLVGKSFENGRLTYNREIKRKLQQVLFEGAMRRPCGQNYGS